MVRDTDLQNRQIEVGRRRGRPAIGSGRVQVTLPPHVYDAYDRIARTRDEPLGRVIREVLERRISLHK